MDSRIEEFARATIEHCDNMMRLLEQGARPIDDRYVPYMRIKTAAQDQLVVVTQYRKEHPEKY